MHSTYTYVMEFDKMMMLNSDQAHNDATGWRVVALLHELGKKIVNVDQQTGRARNFSDFENCNN